MQPLFQTLSDLSQATGNAVSRTVGSVTAGVGNVASAVVPVGEKEKEAPKVQAFSSDEAHKKFKEFNTELNLKLNKLREWSGYLGTAVFWLMASAMAIVTKGVLIDGGTTAATAGAAAATGAAATQLNMGALWVGLSSPAFWIVAGVTVALGTAKMIMSQHITKLQTEKGMDVSDFHLKREAELTGQEVAKNISTVLEKSPDQTIQNLMHKAGSHVHSISHEGLQQEPMAAKGMTH